MVDLHCHVLPGVDDGAKCISDSLEMLRKAAAAGIETVVATPHLLRGIYEMEFLEREQMVAGLQKAADENGIDIQIKSGVECYLSREILEDTSKLGELTLNNNGKYILVELPMQAIPSYAEDALLSGLNAQGITPVLAHPERNMGICGNPNILFDFVMKGCIAQLNVGSILGYFGRRIRKVARILLTHNLVHVIASDMHSPNSPTLDQVVPVVEKLLGPERTSRMLTEIPRQILAGETFYKEPPQRFESARRSLRSILLRHKM
jgi:protein-tyrosine phosphatase